MDYILGIVLKYSARRYEEDIVDRLNFQYTAYAFAVGALVVSYGTYVGSPINCWVPAEFRKGWYEYARDYCLIENTYYLPLENADMPEADQREKIELPYYQWVQFILVGLAFLFYLPHVLWRTINWRSGLQVRAVVKSLSTIEEKKRQETVAKLAKHIWTFNERNKKNNSLWISMSYLLTKVLFLINIAAQILIIHQFLGFSWNDFFKLRIGFNSDWKANGIFPRQTMCDFDVRNKGSVQQYSVQCVLAMNMFNEKIFLFLFYWLLLLFVISLVNLFLWCSSVFSSRNRANFASRMLRAAGQQSNNSFFLKSPTIEEEKKPLKTEEEHNRDIQGDYNKFVSLNPELAVILQLIASNAGDTICSEVTAALFQLSQQKHQ